nr:ABC-type transport auxiliary lipoprotein family protein [Thiobacillus sp.]
MDRAARQALRRTAARPARPAWPLPGRARRRVVRSDLMLDTRLVEFYHDATREPGQVRLELRAELMDLKQRRLLGRHTFEQKVPLTTYDAAGAAQASNLAVSRVLDDVSAWLATFK